MTRKHAKKPRRPIPENFYKNDPNPKVARELPKRCPICKGEVIRSGQRAFCIKRYDEGGCASWWILQRGEDARDRASGAQGHRESRRDGDRAKASSRAPVQQEGGRVVPRRKRRSEKGGAASARGDASGQAGKERPLDENPISSEGIWGS